MAVVDQDVGKQKDPEGQVFIGAQDPFWGSFSRPGYRVTQRGRWPYRAHTSTMSVSELDLETGQRVALVKYGIDGLRLLQGNLATLLTELDGLKDTAAAIEAGEHESISHPHVCSVLHTLMRTASASVLLAELSFDRAIVAGTGGQVHSTRQRSTRCGGGEARGHTHDRRDKPMRAWEAGPRANNVQRSAHDHAGGRVQVVSSDWSG